MIGRCVYDECISLVIFYILPGDKLIATQISIQSEDFIMDVDWDDVSNLKIVIPIYVIPLSILCCCVQYVLPCTYAHVMSSQSNVFRRRTSLRQLIVRHNIIADVNSYLHTAESLDDALLKVIVEKDRTTFPQEKVG